MVLITGLSMKNEGFSGGGRSQWPSYIHEKDGVIRLDRFILRAGKGLAATSGATAVCFGVVAGSGRGSSRQ
jgi:hypothetical protein